MATPSGRSVSALVVWIPMIDGDELAAARAAGTLFAGAPVPQFWDGAQRFGREVSRSSGQPDQVAWDIYLFYGPDAEWGTSGLPPPDAALAQVGLAGGGGVVAARGTLPPRGDQSRLPANLRDRAVLAGSYDELPELLRAVAAHFNVAPAR